MAIWPQLKTTTATNTKSCKANDLPADEQLRSDLEHLMPALFVPVDTKGKRALVYKYASVLGIGKCWRVAVLQCKDGFVAVKVPR